MNLLKKHVKKKYFPYLFGFIFISLIHLYFVMKNDSLMVFYGDSFEEEVLFYLGGWEKFRISGFSFWDWSIGFGANSFSLVFYYLTSPFFYLSLIFEKIFIPYLFLYINALKLFLLYTFGYLWLHRSNNRLSSMTGALILTFSGWVMFFYHYNFFLDAFLIFPLILYFLEESVERDKSFGLVFSIGFLGIVNFYFLYMFIPFLGMYVLFKLYNLEFTFKEKFRILTRTLLYVALGLGLSCFILLPSFSIILSAPRLQGISFDQLVDVANRFDLFRFFSSLFTPVMERFDPSYFMSTQIFKGLGWGGGVSIFSSYLFPILFPYLFKFDRKTRDSYLGFYAVLILLSLFPIFYRLMQGTFEVRWFYMFVLLNVSLLTKIINDHRQFEYDLKFSLLAGLGSMVMISVLYIISKYKGYYGTAENLISLNLVVAYALVITFLYLTVLSKRKPNYHLIFVIVLIESMVNFAVPLIKNPPIEKNILEDYMSSINDRSVIDYLETKDQGFYRILKDNQTFLNQNEPFAQNYKGMSFYSSVYSYALDSYYDRFNETYSIPNTYGRDDSYLLTAFKYFITDSNHHAAPFGFEKIESYGNYDIYQNRYFVPLGYVQMKTLSEAKFNQLNYMEQDYQLLNYAVTKDSKNAEVVSNPGLMEYASSVHSDRYYLVLPDVGDGIKVIIENPNINGIKMRFLHNGEFLFEEEYYQYFYISRFIEPDSPITEIEIILPFEDESPEGYNLFLDTNLSDYKLWYQELSKGFLSNIREGKDSITADFTSYEDQTWLVTSIPFDQGWKATIDGREVETVSINSGFIGVSTTKGQHHVEFKYETPFLKWGSILSISSLIVTAILFVIKKMKTRIK